jgi:hypothetical protein
MIFFPGICLNSNSIIINGFSSEKSPLPPFGKGELPNLNF